MLVGAAVRALRPVKPHDNPNVVMYFYSIRNDATL